MGLETPKKLSGEAAVSEGSFWIAACYPKAKEKSWMRGKLAFLLLFNLTDVFLQIANSSESFTL